MYYQKTFAEIRMASDTRIYLEVRHLFLIQKLYFLDPTSAVASNGPGRENPQLTLCMCINLTFSRRKFFDYWNN